MTTAAPEDRDTASAWRLALCLAVALAVLLATPGPQALRAGLAIFALAAALWMSQAIPLAVTALLVPLLSVLAGLQPPAQALAPFASPVIFLFLGGFALAAALQQQGLARALAGSVLRLAGGRRDVAVVLVAALSALVSMWLSNTATAVLMLPLALGLLDDQEDPPGPAEQAFVLLSMTYATALGGMASLVSTPPNALAGAQAGISFARWFGMAGPLAALLWVAMLAVLYLVLRPRLGGRVARGAVQPIAWNRQRVATAVIFALTVAGWVGGDWLARVLAIRGDSNALVALAAVVALIASGCLRWRELERQVQWGVLLLFGGGLALSEVMAASGGSRFLVEGLLALLQGAPPLLVLLGVVAFVVVLSELMSNTASAALALPLFLPMAGAMGLAPQSMAVAIALAASCGFMLPVATPPNALVFATGRIPQATMVRCGWRLNAVCILAITAAAHWLWG